MQLIKMLLVTLVLFSGAQISSNETFNSKSTKSSAEHRITQNKNQKSKSSFWLTRFHNPKVMMPIGNKKKLDIKKISLALFSINYFCPENSIYQCLLSIPIALCFLYRIKKDPKNTGFDFITMALMTNSTISFMEPHNNYHHKGAKKKICDTRDIYLPYIKSLITISYYLGAAYVTGTFSPIVDEDDNENFDNANPDKI